MPIFVRKWEPGCDSIAFDMRRVPVWVKLKNVPLELFTRLGLSFIASGLGKPLYMDRAIALRQKVDFAKMCIEIEYNREVPACMEMELKNGAVATIKVEVPWMLPRCHSCCVFGHHECKNEKMQNATQKWLPKSAEVIKENVETGQREEVGVGRVRTPVANRDKAKGKNKLEEEGSAEGAACRPDKEKVVLVVRDSSGGRSESAKGKDGGANRSVNRYAILQGLATMEEIDEVIEEPEEYVPSLRKARAASTRVRDLMIQMKLKRKSLGVKNKAKVVKAGEMASKGTSHSSQ